MESYGEMIARLRDDRGWTQQKLADESGVPKRTIQDIELNKVKRPQRATRDALHRALEIEGDPDETMRGLPADVKAFLMLFGAFLANLPEKRRLEIMQDITNGDIFSDQPNGGRT